MLLTLPLVRVFMWLIGRQTGLRARERWQALSLLATHFLDVVRGLPTLRAFNRGEAQVARIARGKRRVPARDDGDVARRVPVGGGPRARGHARDRARRRHGRRAPRRRGIGFEPALTVLVLAPELYLPLRNLAAQFHASADGVAVAERLLGLIERAARPPAVDAGRHRARARAGPVRATSRSPTRPAAALVLDDVDFELAPGRDGRARRRERRRARARSRRCCSGSREPTAGGSPSAASTSPPATPRPGGSQLAWVPQRPTLFRGTVADNIRLGDPARRRRGAVREAAARAGADAFVAGLPDG